MRSEQAFFRSLADRYHAEGAFGHRQHLHLTWSAVSRFGSAGAPQRIAAFIRHVAESTGVPEKYNETITLFWVRLVAHVMENRRARDGFDGLVDDYPALLDKTLPLRHWSSVALWSDAAKRGWVEPDVRPLAFD